MDHDPVLNVIGIMNYIKQVREEVTQYSLLRGLAGGLLLVSALIATDDPVPGEAVQVFLVLALAMLMCAGYFEGRVWDRLVQQAQADVIMASNARDLNRYSRHELDDEEQASDTPEPPHPGTSRVPGWYSDPWGSSGERYYDGAGWGESR